MVLISDFSSVAPSSQELWVRKDKTPYFWNTKRTASHLMLSIQFSMDLLCLSGSAMLCTACTHTRTD